MPKDKINSNKQIKKKINARSNRYMTFTATNSDSSVNVQALNTLKGFSLYKTQLSYCEDIFASHAACFLLRIQHVSSLRESQMSCTTVSSLTLGGSLLRDGR
ncbi:hypothetical protein ILYODFUR_022871 [Ilyodon furcidens]|uniref:Uncharacterized protein n=1 Tax=Ilyodon furcidens TaxID=33524 RepID=A0ABV0UJR6_9TELE